MKVKGLVYVLVQFLAIASLLYYTHFELFGWSFVIHLAAMALAVWAGLALNNSRLSILPEIKEGAQFVQSGPYRLIRHPMYTALLLFFIPTAVNSGNALVPFIFVLLLFTLISKMKYEETMLLHHFSGYQNYSQKTYYLIPYIY